MCTCLCDEMLPKKIRKKKLVLNKNLAESHKVKSLYKTFLGAFCHLENQRSSYCTTGLTI